jgi:type VI secretion system protein ImpE
MTSMELFTAGRLSEAVMAQRGVAAGSSCAGERLFLAELHLIRGAFDEAREVLDALHSDAADLHDYLTEFHLLLDAAERRERFILEGKPHFLADPPPHAIFRLKAIRALRIGRNSSAERYIDRADEDTPFISGHVDGREFEGLRDGDDRFASVLEALTAGKYVWVPFEEIRRLRIGKIETPRDQFFLPAQLRLHDGSEMSVHLPVLYPGSHAHPDEAIRSGRETDWQSDGAGPVCGVGLRLWTFGEDEDLTPWEFTQLELRRG